jgi:hypothetical protein
MKASHRTDATVIHKKMTQKTKTLTLTTTEALTSKGTTRKGSYLAKIAWDERFPPGRNRKKMSFLSAS